MDVERSLRESSPARGVIDISPFNYKYALTRMRDDTDKRVPPVTRASIIGFAHGQVARQEGQPKSSVTKGNSWTAVAGKPIDFRPQTLREKPGGPGSSATSKRKLHKPRPRERIGAESQRASHLRRSYNPGQPVFTVHVPRGDRVAATGCIVTREITVIIEAFVILSVTTPLAPSSICRRKRCPTMDELPQQDAYGESRLRNEPTKERADE